MLRSATRILSSSGHRHQAVLRVPSSLSHRWSSFSLEDESKFSATAEYPDFNDAKSAYETKTAGELIRAGFCFRLCKIPMLVNNAESLLHQSRKFFGNTITDAALKATMFGHFCAGEDEKRIRPVVKKLQAAGIGSILDYAAENDGPPSANTVSERSSKAETSHTVLAREYDYESEAQCDKHVETFKKCIGDVAKSGAEHGFAAIKVTALGNPKLLARKSQTVVETKNLFVQFDKNRDGLISRDEFEQGYNHYFKEGTFNLRDVFDEYDPAGTGQIDYITWAKALKPTDLPKITSQCRSRGPLTMSTPTEEELELIEAMFQRGYALAKEASVTGTRLLIDAEQLRYQPAIDSLVLTLQQKYNSADAADHPLIYNTYQCYMKDTAERLRIDMERSERFGFHFGAKMVRGAYMESERMLARSLGRPSPIHDTMEDTHNCYNDSIDKLLQFSTQSENNVELMVATHNQESIEKAIEAMNKYGIDKSSYTICFAQLYGMSDNLTGNLGKHGYRAYKYVPYGEVHEVMPYLLRRARENSSVVGGAAHELDMIRGELRRRLATSLKLSTV